MIESIEKLRESSHLDDSKWTLETGEVIHVYGSEPNDPNAVNWGEQWRKIADEIEAEIESRYMLLPLDADGVPIHVGDTLECRANGYDGVFDAFAVGDGCVIGNHPECEVFNDPFKGIHVARYCRHVAPRTIEDVLRDVWEEALDYSKSDMWRNPDEVFVERAEEIRELMEVDA